MTNFIGVEKISALSITPLQVLEIALSFLFYNVNELTTIVRYKAEHDDD